LNIHPHLVTNNCKILLGPISTNCLTPLFIIKTTLSLQRTLLSICLINKSFNKDELELLCQ
jgi:hypothetical protein